MNTSSNTKAPSATPGATTPKGSKSKVAGITTMGMTIMIITTVVSLRGLASQAEFGIQSIFWYVLAGIVYLVPFALVCAELASTYTHSGGLYRWISEAYGTRWGWTGMYLEWQCLVIWFPAVLMFGAVSLAYIFWPESFDGKLASNKLYTILIVLGVYWFATFNSFRGMKKANFVSQTGGLFGTIIPAALLIIMGVVYLLMDGKIELVHESFFPDFTKISTIVFAASIFLFFGGMEMNAVHVPMMKNPRTGYPKALFLAVIVILVVFIGGTLAIGFVTPAKDINLLATLLTTYHKLFATIHCPWLGNVIALMVTYGVIGQVSVIVTGPSTGLVAVGESGFLPPALQKTNKNGINTTILWIQGIFVTILAFVLVILPSVQSAYQILSQMSTILYLILCIMIYMAFLRLRRTEPNKKRGFKVPGGKFVEWLIGIVGITGLVFASIISFFPPSQINTGSPAVYVGVLIAGVVIFVALPLVVYACRKPNWKNKNADFYPFDWQIEDRKPDEVSKWSPNFEPTPAMVEVAKQRDAMEVADWISNRQALLNTYHDVEKLQSEVSDLEQRVQKDESKATATAGTNGAASAKIASESSTTSNPPQNGTAAGGADK
ncbi:MAG: amino acid permease [Muribaculaceae bacterium]|nr:amino acid permease [Muribaculaceae bacterium]